MDTLPPHTYDGNTPQKQCTGPCRRTLPATPEYFYHHRKGGPKLCSICKECSNQANRKYMATAEAKERRKARSVARYAANREKNLADNKDWRERNKERRRDYKKRYNEETREHQSAQNKIWRETHREQLQAYEDARKEKRAAYRVVNKERINVYHRNYRKNHDEIKDRHHGVSRAEKRLMAEKQGYQCAICGKKIEELKKLYVDHNHTTGHVRGLLCPHCNYVLGHCFENVDILRQAASYLERHNENENL